MTTTTTTETETGFSSLGLHKKLLTALERLGYEEATPIQRQTIPLLIERRDLFGQAATGTGKTAAFALPILQRIIEMKKRPSVTALVLVPTRELAVQVAEAMHRYGSDAGVRVLPIYGGQPMGRQLRSLQEGVDVVVATPGRALDHIGRGSLRLDGIDIVVLDEADEMLDMGFAEDIDTILGSLPKERQTVLFSATMPPRIAALTKRHMRDPMKIEIPREASTGKMPRVRQVAYIVSRSHKVAALGRILDLEAPTAALIFCRTRTEVDELTRAMGARGYHAEALHGGMSQELRDKVMRRVRAGSAELLIATDVAARGLDIEQLTHVINFDVPSAPESYVHRIGRVGRAGKKGVAIMLVEPRESRTVRNIEQLTRQKIEMAQLPTIADLRERQFELTQASLREALLAGGLERFRVIVESLSDEFELIDVATAAVKLAHEAGGAEMDHEEIPAPGARGDRYGERDDRRGPRESGGREGFRSREPRPDGPRPSVSRADATRIYIGGAGRAAGIRPGDLVGAITNEAGISGQQIFGIEISDRFSLVEVASDVADSVIGALKQTSIRGKKITVRRDKERE
ncbi:MAG TPA: DEAD/DEAH box helicase [Candidatus Kapabacteria bacterium]|jgi:ATP-dependent RNA helicase DeaD|nr:DEAD/DEAH box helicase [Candidatus Kapabacteria bacterium]